MELKPNGGQSLGDADIVTLELTKQEAMALVQLIDAAVRARGLEAAEAGLILHRKLQLAVQAKLQP
jgi:hypothetical protein